MTFRFLRRRAVTREFLEAWAEYERQSAAAADDYAAHTAPRSKYDSVRPQPRPCPRCDAMTRARTENCRACVREEREDQ